MTDSSKAEPWRAIVETVCTLMREMDMHKRNLTSATDKAQREQAQLLLEILGVVDAFERVFANVEPRLEGADKQTKIWVGNFRSVRKALDGVLTKHGVALIQSPDRMAVPGLHTIIETREQLDLDDGTIVEEVQHGYLWHGQVLRQAQVVAVRN